MVFVSPLTAKETETMAEDQEDIRQDSSYVCFVMCSSLETSDMCTSIVNGRLVPQKCHERPMPESSPTQTTTSSEHKMFPDGQGHLLSPHLQKNQVTSVMLPPLLPQAPSGMHPLPTLSNNHYTALRLNHSLQEFHPTQQVTRELNHLQKIAFLFITLRFLLYAF